MLAVPDTPAAVDWYKEALGASVLWSFGSVAGLEIDGAPQRAVTLKTTSRPGDALAGWVHRPLRTHLVGWGQVSLEPLPRIVVHSRPGGRTLDRTP